jgi:hypothetical protein
MSGICSYRNDLGARLINSIQVPDSEENRFILAELCLYIAHRWKMPVEDGMVELRRLFDRADTDEFDKFVAEFDVYMEEQWPSAPTVENSDTAPPVV